MSTVKGSTQTNVNTVLSNSHRIFPRDALRLTNLRLCPACHRSFERAKVPVKKSSLRLCPYPDCGVSLFFTKGSKHRPSQTILWADKEAAEAIVQLLEKHISDRDNLKFNFTTERSVELIHAYAIVERAKNYLIRQNDPLHLCPYEFATEALTVALQHKFYGQFNSLLSFRNCIAGFAQDLYKLKRRENKSLLSQLSSSLDYTNFYLEPRTSTNGSTS